ncbi:MAG: hypothetical protein KDM64_13905, partial [Verrucomicrobiae bacterium]|nr:hypothetical protein [Verrucomicrobiae bacterium]
IFELDNHFSDVFAAATADLLVEGYEKGHRFNRDLEGAAVRALDLATDPVKRQDLRQRYLAAWTARYLGGEHSRHLYNLLGRTAQMAWRDGNDDIPNRIFDTFSDFGTHPASFVSAVNAGKFDLALDLQRKNLDWYRYHPRTLDRYEDFDEKKAAYLSWLETQDSGAGDAFPPSAMSLHARAMFASLDGVSSENGWQEECRSIAEDIAEAYLESDTPPHAVNRALYLACGWTPEPPGLEEPLRDWFASYDFLRLINNGNRFSDIELRPLQHHFAHAFESRDMAAIARIADSLAPLASLDRIGLGSDYFNPLMQTVVFKGGAALAEFISESTEPTGDLETWMTLFQSIASLRRQHWNDRYRGREIQLFYAAALLAGRESSLDDWWRNLPPTHREFVEQLACDAQSAPMGISRLLMRAKWIRESRDRRFDMGALTLTLPGVRDSHNIVNDWIRSELVNPTDLLKWAPKVIDQSPRGGNTAYSLAVYFSGRNDNETALVFLDAADAAKPNETDQAIFNLKRAQFCLKRRQTEEAVALLQSVIKDGRLPAKDAQTAQTLLDQWTNPVGSPK